MSKIKLPQQATDEQIVDTFLEFFVGQHQIDELSPNPKTLEAILSRIKLGEKKARRELSIVCGKIIAEAVGLYCRFRPGMPPEGARLRATNALWRAAVYYKPTASYSFGIYALWWILASFGVGPNQKQ